MAEKQKCASELDKLKRRMIRTVSRLLKEKKTEEQVWEELKKESGANCKTLWERMRSLTMKKLKRLLDVDDRVEQVPVVARMTLTDWLLYDMVIVHEKVDVIDRANPLKEDSKVLTNLFSLVKMFSIEGRCGDDLAEAWTAATVYYNSKGHQCSPMLMQRRWYQIKELTRHKMYKFWFNYRGNQRLLLAAKQDPPTELQKAIALRYPEIITQPFPEWGARIDLKLVIMPEEFEVKMRNKSLMKPCDDSVPDVLIVEQKVDTITLADSDSDFSDDENSRESQEPSLKPDDVTENEEMQTPIIVQVKTEPQDDIDISETIYQPPSEQANNRLLDEINRLTMVEDKIVTEENHNNSVGIIQGENEVEESMLPLITNVKGAVDTVNENTFLNDAPIDDKELRIEESTETQESILIDDDDDDFPNVRSEKKMNTEVINEMEVVNQNEDDSGTEIINPHDFADHINRKEVVNQTEVLNQPEEFRTETIINITSPEAKRITKSEPVEPIIDMLEIDEPTILAGTISPIPSCSTVTMDVDTDIGSEYTETIVNIIPPVTSTEDSQTPITHMAVEDNKTNKFNYRDDVISDMNFADDGIEFADEGIEYIEDDDQDGTPVGEETRNSVRGADDTPKFDLKLLMDPVVYTTKLDAMSVYKTRPLNDTIDKIELLDKIVIESKPVSIKSINVDPDKTENIIAKVENLDTNDTHDTDDDLFRNESDEDSDMIPDTKKVKLSSNLLQKPKSRTYNPIQLCKNPDFNTRLKRLNVGFFSYTRNRMLLKACKPMTIDLSKAFESKLVDGTIYLKPSDQTVKVEIEDDRASTSVLPSAVPVQSLMDTTDVDKILQEELKKRILERSKPITLPHINVVRQINQNLLMAEVAPIMALTEKSEISINARSKDDTIADKQIDTIVDEPISASAYCEEKPTTITGTHQANVEVKIEGKNPTVSKNPLLHNLLQDKQPVNVPPNNSSILALNNYNVENPKPGETIQPSKLEKLLEKRKKILEKKNSLPSWITKTGNSDSARATDTLLTIDTLYKMLHALDPSKEYASKLNKPKSKISKKLAKINTSNKLDTNSRNKNEQSLDVIIIDDTTNHMVNRNRTKVVNKPLSRSKKKTCCWARSKILKLTGETPSARLSSHRCGQYCKCCCKEDLRQAALDIEVKILQESRGIVENVQSVIDGAVQQQFVQSCKNSAVQVVNLVTSPTHPSATMTDVGLQIYADQSDVEIVNHSEENRLETNTEPIMQSDDAEVTIDLDNEDANPTSSNEVSLPTPKIRICAADNINRNNIVPSPSISRNRNSYAGRIEAKLIGTQSVIPPLYPKVPPKKLQRETTCDKGTSPNRMSSKEVEDLETPCSCRPNVAVEKSSAMLCIDGSNDCLRHSKSRISKETRIYINRKHMSETERPFYVGKNKILLTNVKQPAPPPPSPPPAPVELTLPEGVQVVLLPDGTISYLVDPNVELTPEQIISMPLILTAVQEQIKATGITIPVNSAQNDLVVNVNSDVSQSLQVTNDGENGINSSDIVENNKEIDNTNEKTTTLDSDTTQTATTNLQDQVDSESENKTKLDTTPPDLIKETNENLNESASTTRGHSELANTESKVLETDLVNSADAMVLSEAINNVSSINVVADIKNNISCVRKDQDVATNINNGEECSLTDNGAFANQETTSMDTSESAKSPTSSLPTEITVNEDNSVPSDKAFSNKETTAMDTSEIAKSPTSSLPAPTEMTDNEDNLVPIDEAFASKETTAIGASEIAKSPTSLLLDTTEVTDNENNSQSTDEALTGKELAAIKTSEKDKLPTSSLLAAPEITDNEHNSLSTDEASSSKETTAMDTSETSKSHISSLPASTEIDDSNEHNYAESPEKNKASSESVDDENNAATSSRNLLSDLMEMSGIMTEDTVPQQQIAGTNAPPGAFVHPLASSIDLTAPNLSPLSSRHVISAQIDEKVHELNPITSFAELKYACDNDGLFFKLDLNTGLIVPINVCIQKSTPETTSNKTRMNPTEVIDLTDEQGVSIDKETFSVSQHTTNNESQSAIKNINVNTGKKIVPRKLSTMMPEQTKLVQKLPDLPKVAKKLPSQPKLVKKLPDQPKLVQIKPKKSKPTQQLPEIPTPDICSPEKSMLVETTPSESNPVRGRGRPPKKLFQIRDPFSPQNMIMKKQQLLSRLSNNLKPLKMLHKQNINILRKKSLLSNDNIILPYRSRKNLDATINLADSDAPMVESSEESDDEPLAKIAKKMRSGKDNVPPVTETTNEEVSQSEDDKAPLPNDDNVNNDNIDFEQAIDSLVARLNTDKEPVPTQLVLSGPTLNQPILLNDAFLTGNEDDDDSQEDCILGV